MRNVFSLPLMCAFLLLTVFGAFGCHDGDVRDNLEAYYLVTLSAVENTCLDNGGGGPTNGTQLPVAVEATSATTFNFALGGGTENPLIVPNVEVNADGTFNAEITLPMNDPDSPPGMMEFSGIVTPDELNADLVLRVGWEDENGMFVEFCRIAAYLTGPPCGRACDNL